jgi:hypothetical protein
MPRTPRRRGKIAGVSLDDPEAVDSVGTLRDGSAVVLTIEDDRDWADEPAHSPRCGRSSTLTWRSLGPLPPRRAWIERRFGD